MTLIAHFRLVSESEDTSCYEERIEQGLSPAIGILRIQNKALPRPIPSSLRIALDFFGSARPFNLAVERATNEALQDKKVLKEGKSVTVVKSTLAGVHYPPEWEQQYLGRTGSVLYTTADGAEVKLGDAVTWFHSTELKVVE